jgi:hypothetical protein
MKKFLFLALIILALFALPAPTQAAVTNCPLLFSAVMADDSILPLTTLCVYTKDATGAALNGIVVKVDVCAVESALPCAGWINQAQQATFANGAESGIVVAPIMQNSLYRVTASTCVQTFFIALGETSKRIECIIAPPTKVELSTFSASADTIPISPDVLLLLAGAFLLGAYFVGTRIGGVK